MLLLGDFNAAPYYRADAWAPCRHLRAPGWYANTLSYPVLLHYTGAVDLALRGRAEADADLDITAGDAVPNNPAGALTSPFGMPSYCAAVPRDAFTATDCNSLVLHAVRGHGVPRAARLRSPVATRAERLHVQESRVVFTDPVACGVRRDDGTAERPLRSARAPARRAALTGSLARRRLAVTSPHGLRASQTPPLPTPGEGFNPLKHQHSCPSPGGGSPRISLCAIILIQSFIAAFGLTPRGSRRRRGFAPATVTG